MSSPQPGPAHNPGTARDPRIVSNGRDPERPPVAAGASSGVLGARPLMAQTFQGGDPDTVAASAICDVTPTSCQARTRLYRDGRLELEGFPVSEISDHLADEAVTIWLDLRD